MKNQKTAWAMDVKTYMTTKKKSNKGRSRVSRIGWAKKMGRGIASIFHRPTWLTPGRSR